jgi:glycerol-1-phosphate dehydrogenase [NAD(P)+]
MKTNRIERALALADTTKNLVIESGAINKIDTVFRKEFAASSAIVIADTNTYAAAGDAVYSALEGAGINIEAPFIFPGTPRLHADLERVTELKAHLNSHQAIPVAVGSGTINDITKFACTQLRRPYMIVATAASMDGYTSFGASISHAGFKKNVPCTAPRAVLADLEVLGNAPDEMITWGYGDLLSKVIAGADWILADELEIEQIDQDAWSMVMDPLPEWVSNPEGVKEKDPKVISNVLEGLVVTGLAMQVAKSSRVAAGSDHIIGHLWEMEELTTNKGEHIPHGLFIGVGTVVAAALYDVLLQYDLAELDIKQASSSWKSFEQVANEVNKIFDQPYMIEQALEECRAKYINQQVLEDRLQLLKDRWYRIKKRLKTQLMSAGELQDRLRRAGAMTSPSGFGVNASALRKYYLQGLRVRNRYTILDLLDETGLLENTLNKILTGDGFWAGIEP